MRERLTRSLDVIAPPLLAVSAIAYALYRFLRWDFDGQVSPLDIGFLSLPIREDATHSALILMLGMAAMFYSLTRDYSKVLPNKLTFVAFFDTDGIRDLLNKSSTEGAKIKIADNWPERCATLQRKILRDIKNKSSINVDLAAMYQISAKGMTTFFVTKANRGLQSYDIIEVDGYLHFDIPIKGSFITIKSFFSLNSSSRDNLSISIKQMIFKRTFLLCPLMRQTYITGLGNEVIFENTIALTFGHLEQC